MYIPDFSTSYKLALDSKSTTISRTSESNPIAFHSRYSAGLRCEAFQTERTSCAGPRTASEETDSSPEAARTKCRGTMGRKSAMSPW